MAVDQLLGPRYGILILRTENCALRYIVAV
jgi:hypothetical protein